jgi:glycosyltransferase involved in cell wall biosynthesis
MSDSFIADVGAYAILPYDPHLMAELAVVIPTYNSASTIQTCLESVLSQAYAPKEVVVVDDIRTSDSTREIAREMGASLMISDAAMAASRNVGFKATTSEYLLSIDSDMALRPRLLENVVAAFEKGVDALTIKEISTGFGYWTRARKIDKMAVELTGFGMSLRAFTRSVFESVGGYDESLEAGEDLDFHRRVIEAGARLDHITVSFIEHHEGEVRLIGAARKKYKYGLTVPAFAAKHGGKALRGGFGRRLRVGCAYGWRHDRGAVPGFLLLKVSEAGAGAMGRIIGRHRPNVRAEAPNF